MRMCVRCKHTTQTPVTVRRSMSIPDRDGTSTPALSAHLTTSTRGGVAQAPGARRELPAVCTNSACDMGRALQQVHRATRK